MRNVVMTIVLAGMAGAAQPALASTRCGIRMSDMNLVGNRILLETGHLRHNSPVAHGTGGILECDLPHRRWFASHRQL
jgi:hypothetical protein